MQKTKETHVRCADGNYYGREQTEDLASTPKGVGVIRVSVQQKAETDQTGSVQEGARCGSV